MQSLKSETDLLFRTIYSFEKDAKEADARDAEAQASIRDLGKKITNYEADFDETNDKLTKTTVELEEKEKNYKAAEDEVSALARRLMLMEDEAKKADTTLADTVTKLALASKEADGIQKKVSTLRTRP